MTTHVGSARGQIQRAMSTKMRASDTLMAALTGGVKDFRNVSRGTAFPYVSIGDTTEIEGWSSFGDGTGDEPGPVRGYDDTVTLHIWSFQPEVAECQAILELLNGLFDGKSLLLDSLHHIGSWYLASGVLPDPTDPKITHMWVRYRVGAQEES